MTSTHQKEPGKEILIYFVLLVVGLYFAIRGLIYASGFFIPITISVILALICIPLARKLDRRGLPRGISALVCVLVSFVTFISFFVLITFQIAQFSDEWPKIKQKVRTGIEAFEEFVSENTGFTFQDDINQLFSSNQNKSEKNDLDSKSEDGNSEKEEKAESSQPSLTNQIPDGLFSRVGGILMGFFSFLGNSLLVLIYLFFLLYYRSKIKKSILNFFGNSDQEKVKEVFSNIIQLAFDFLIGRLILIAFLAVLYSIGLSISGIENAILISILAAFLTLIPYIGNVIGVVIAMFMAAFSGGELGMYIGVAITYSITQFVESYILQPYVVGGKVNINPLVAIVVVVLGGSIWGVAGMIISIPVIGIFKVIFDAVPALKPMGYFLGQEGLEEEEDEEPSQFKKLGKKIWSKFSDE